MVSELLGNGLQAAGLQKVRCHQPARHLQQPLFHLLEFTVVVFVVSDFCFQTEDSLLQNQVSIRADFGAKNLLRIVLCLKTFRVISKLGKLDCVKKVPRWG